MLKGAQMLDALTIYKDRRPFPHKLCNAVDAYQLKTQNTTAPSTMRAPH